ncbi:MULTISPECIES: hypothetical protein [unclassified Streptomyces]|uniref:hypothetical protein n=1 Tax=Streptomyces TaxID=1883 RepID=UPI000B1B9F7B|nr:MULTISPECIES: hypothetical protein [unclassified Streptomyces]
MELHQGETVALSPTGPMTNVAGDDEASVLAVLREYTNVIEESGRTPQQPRMPSR